MLLDWLMRASRNCLVALAVALAPVAWEGMQVQGQETYEPQRKRMLEEIASLARETRIESGRATLRQPVMAALAKVPRHEFVPAQERRNAYDNRPLPIGMGQTISQPFIVALMTDLLEVKHGDRVLEIGTGSGYQAALLAELAGAVYSIEIVEPLAREAAERLQRLGYRNVVTRAGDGYLGWPEQAPFDAIIATAGGPRVPETWRTQLAVARELLAEASS